MAEQTKPSRDPLINVLLEANKRAGLVLESTRAVAAKLFGPRPEDSVASMQEMSVAGLASRLLATIAELEDELGRQHNGLGDAAAAPLQQGRAVASY